MVTETTNIQVIGEMQPGYENILTSEALRFIEKLERHFGGRRKELLERRQIVQEEMNQGQLPQFLKETKHIREGKWTIAPLPKDLRDRRVEITGSVDRKIIINALNSGANLFMADFADATSPTWSNCIDGQINLHDTVHGNIKYEATNGKQYSLLRKTAVLAVRPRGLHMIEKHVIVDGQPISASFFDFGLYFFHNAKALIHKKSGPYFYLSKLESHLEARLWNDIFVYSQNELNIPQSTIKATVQIDTIPAVFEMHEILYELKEHSAGLNCGRWDYIFSFLKKSRHNKQIIFPDRSQITMLVPNMRAYSLLTIQTCHDRNAPAIGGMAVHIPNKDDIEKNDRALAEVRADKEREARDGHDGTWVAHPDLVGVAREVFDLLVQKPNQIYRKREDIRINEKDLLEVPIGTITEDGLRKNIHISIRYIASWLNGKGAIQVNGLMEDASTVELARAQVWHWIHHPEATLEDGRSITSELFQTIQQEELAVIKAELGENSFAMEGYIEAAKLFEKLSVTDEFAEFFTTLAYEKLS